MGGAAVCLSYQMSRGTMLYAMHSCLSTRHTDVLAWLAAQEYATNFDSEVLLTRYHTESLRFL